MIGRVFHSDAERRYGEKLWLMEKAGEISDLKFQVRVRLLGLIPMIVDFRYNEGGETIWHEYKGLETSAWRLQRKVWELFGPGHYRVTHMKGRDEDIYPKPSAEVIRMVLRHLLKEYEDV